MLRILGKNLRISKSATMVVRSESEIDAHDLFDELSSWEFVNPSDDEQEDSYSFTDQTDDDVELMLKEDDPCEIGSPSSDISMKSEAESGSPSPVQTIDALVVCPVGFNHHDTSRDDDQEEDDEEEEEEEEEDYDYDLDDELVPNWLCDKLGRQRIRKLGKRACSKMNKSRKAPYVFNRPGCVHGKHGFGHCCRSWGIQHTFREQNRLVDRLAQEGSKQEVFGTPSVLIVPSSYAHEESEADNLGTTYARQVPSVKLPITLLLCIH